MVSQPSHDQTQLRLIANTGVSLVPLLSQENMARTKQKAKKCTGGTAPHRDIYKPPSEPSRSMAMAIDYPAPDEADQTAVSHLSFFR